MSWYRLVLAVLLALSPAAFAAKPLGAEVCVAACYNAFTKIKFTDQPGGNATSCLNDLRVKSTFGCARVHCEDQVIEPGIAWWGKQCKKSSKVITVAKYHAAVQGVSLESLQSEQKVEYKEKGTFNNTVLPSDDSWDMVYGSVVRFPRPLMEIGLTMAFAQHAFSVQRHLHDKLGWIQYGFWALVLLVVSSHRVLASTFASFRPAVGVERGEQMKAESATTVTTTWSSTFYRYVLKAPTFGRSVHQTYMWVTFGSRLQSLVILAYIVVHIAVLSVYYPTMPENIYYKSREVQHLRYASDRLAVTAGASMPFIWLFGTRNNFFLWATGLSFNTMQIFHRWVALIFTIESIAHGSVMTAYYLRRTFELCQIRE